MGLEWEPLPTPKRGFEREFEALFHKLAAATGSKREQVVSWFNEVAVPPFETIGAPRVGTDEEANAWLRARLEKSNRLAELEQIKIEMHGYCVLELMPPCDGFPVYSSHKIADHLDRYSFHAERLAGLEDVLGSELWKQAYTMMLPAAHCDFAERLLVAADRFVTESGLPAHVASIREPVFPEGTPESRGHILYAAAKWSTYWSKRGHGLAVSF